MRLFHWFLMHWRWLLLGFLIRFWLRVDVNGIVTFIVPSFGFGCLLSLHCTRGDAEGAKELALWPHFVYRPCCCYCGPVSLGLQVPPALGEPNPQFLRSDVSGVPSLEEEPAPSTRVEGAVGTPLQGMASRIGRSGVCGR